MAFINAKKTLSKSVDYSNSLIKQLSSKLESLERDRKWEVCAYEELPHWLQTNEFLHHGHRPPLDTYTTCLQSTLCWHTETGNIWTHILGIILNSFMIISHFQHFLTNYTRDKLVFISFFSGTFICFLMSTLFHTFSCHSRSVNTLFARIDYCGIFFQIFGSAITLMYFSFYCNAILLKYWFIFSTILFAISMAVSLSRHFNHAHYRLYRTTIYILFSMCGVLPALYWFHQFNWNPRMPSVYNFCYEISSYLLGAMLYSLRIPERYFPGKCDYVWQSHQFFHIMTVFGALFHYYTINDMALNRSIHQCY